jgi:hypothetical protein
LELGWIFPGDVGLVVVGVVVGLAVDGLDFVGDLELDV